MRLRAVAPIVVAVGLVVAARELSARANDARKAWPKEFDAPYAPSAGAVPYVSLGYREVMADLMWIRALAYFGSDEQTTSAGVRHLVQGIAALDPAFEEPMSWGATAMQSLTMRPTQDDYLAVIAILEQAMQRFPNNYRLPQRAGEIYALRLQSDDPAQKRAWKARGAALLSRAVHLPGAPKSLGTYVAHLETELGQRDKAIRDLRELIQYTSDAATRKRLVDKLAKLSAQSSAALDYELDVERARFDQAWNRERPELPAAMFAVIGPALPNWFDPIELSAPDEPPLPAIEPLPALADGIGELPISPTP